MTNQLSTSDAENEALDAALDRLRNPTTTRERLEVLQAVVQYWHGPIQPGDAIPEAELAGLRIPNVLRWWYCWAGHRKEIMTGQNSLLDPIHLKPKDGHLVFYGENQWVYEWATAFDGEDPPVLGRYRPNDPWSPEGVYLSEHLILASLFEALMNARYGASASWLEENKVNQFIEIMPPVSINPWQWLGPTQFYARNGAFMYTMPNGELNGKLGYSVWIGAKTEQSLLFLRPVVDEKWEYVAI